MGASVTLAAAAVAVDPGGEAAVEFRLRNTGSVVDEFSFDVLGDTAAWAEVIPPTISLFPGAEESARIVFRPPRTAAVPAGSIPFGLRARSREDPAGSSVEEGTVEVAPFSDPFAELVPRTSRGSLGGRHDLALDNRGNVRLNAELGAGDADQLVRFDIDPPGLVVDPGMAGFAKIRAAPTKRFWRGPPKTRPFQVFVRPDGGDASPLVLDGTFLQESVLPPWFARGVIALVALLVALVILWLFVLRPSIESAASQAVASPLGELRNDVNDALGAAGLPTLDPGAGGGPSPAATPTPAPGATPGPTPTPAPGGPLIPGLGNPVDGTLDASVPAFAPSGTMFVTDLVFSNPNGREGAAVLLRNGTPLLQLRLENFRDLDFHFVTPIVVVPGDTLNLSLACTSPGPCDPAVFYAGYLRP